MSEPLVSVLMTAYNRERYIAEAIESVLASTYKNFELIIVDDGSVDNTVEIAERYVSNPRVQLHVNAKNLGDYVNRNRAADFARGKYLKYVDSDDLIYAHGLKIMVDTMEQFPDAALGICRPPSSELPYPIQIAPAESYREHFLGEGFLIAGPSGCILRTDAFRELNGFSGKRYVGDTEMWLRLAARHPVVKMIRDLVWWRSHPGQEYRQGNDSHMYLFMNYHVAMNALLDPACPLPPEELQKAVSKMKFRQSRNVWRLALREYDFGSALHLYGDSRLSPKELLKGLVPG